MIHYWHFGEEIDIGILVKAGGWGLASLKLDVVKRNNMNYDLT